MATYQSGGQCFSYLAGEDLSNAVGLAVKNSVTDARTVVIATNGLDIAGVVVYGGITASSNPAPALQTAPRSVMVQASGFAKVQAGGTVTSGAALTVASDGQFITTSTTGDEIVAVAQEPAVDGDLFTVRLSGRAAAFGA